MTSRSHRLRFASLASSVQLLPVLALLATSALGLGACGTEPEISAPDAPSVAPAGATGALRIGELPSAPAPVVRATNSGLEALLKASRTVRPFVTCVWPDDQTGELRVQFGYENRGAAPIELPVGPFNLFLPDGGDRGQPTTFLPGRHAEAFVVPTRAPLAWLVAGNFAVASSTSPRCEAPLACPATCDDANACTNDSCGPETHWQCQHVPVADGTSCSDGDACTTTDVCLGGTCTPGAATVCPSSDGCHPASCDHLSGACTVLDACTLMGTGALPASTRDGLGASPAVLEDGSPHDQVGGIGSAIAYTGRGNFYVVAPDRGPGAGLDSFVERYYLLEISLADGTLTPTLRGGAALVPAPGAAPFIGLERAFDAGTPSAGRRLDVEGLRVSPRGTLYVSDEYGPFVYELSPSGERLRSFVVPEKFLVEHLGSETDELPPNNTKGRQANRGMEGLALSPDGTHLYGIMQSPLLQDGGLDGDGNRVGTNIRILELDTGSGAARELVYQLDKPSYGVNEILAVSDRQLLVLERDGKAGKNAAFKRLFAIDIAGASDVSEVPSLPATGLPAGVTPVKKTPFLDLLDPAYGLVGPAAPEKIEGLAFGPDLPDGRHLLLVTLDNDFLLSQDNRLWAFAVDPRALPGFTAAQATFPLACVESATSCAPAKACVAQGLCNPGTALCTTPHLAARTVCAEGGGSVCDGAGSCVACLTAQDCPGTDDACRVRSCVAGVCGVAYQAAGTPVSSSFASLSDDDVCVTRACDGAGAVVSSHREDGDCGVAAPPTLRVLRVGDGAATLSNNAAPVFVEERALDGQVVGSVPLPVVANGRQQPFTLSGSADSEGGLALSADGRFLALAGYAAPPGLNAVSSTSAASVPRVVARLDAAGVVDTSTLVTGAFNTNNVRGAASLDGSGFWVAGAGGASGGLWYVPFAGTAPWQVLALPTSLRWPAVSGGQLYASSSQNNFVSVLAVGSGAPTATGQTATTPAGLPISGSASPFGYVFLDLDPAVAGEETLYVADDRSAAKGGGVQRWRRTDGVWILTSTLNVGTSPVGFRGLTGFVTAGRATLLATTAESAANRLVRFDDDGVAVAAQAGTVLATSAANTLFRGVALSPRP